MRTSPLISVIVPVYNVEKYLRRCLDSVLAQTFTDFELICVDDASPDASYKILCEYEQKDSRITLLRNEKNGGLSYTRNVGLSHANGKYVYFLDSDDAILPDCLKTLYAVAEKTEADIVVFGAVEKDIGKPDRTYTPDMEICNRMWDGKELFVQMVRESALVPPIPFKLWRKNFLIQSELQFYEGIYHEDELFFFDSMMAARKVFCIPDVFYLYYHSDGSIMRRKFEFKHIASLIVIIHEMQKVLKKNNFAPDVEDAIQDRIALFCSEAERRMSLFGLKKLPIESPLFDRESKELYLFIRRLALYQYKYSFCEEEYECLKSFEHILVYGAGTVARKVIPELLENNISNIEFVVSSTKDNENTLFGFPIKDICSLSYPKETCAVLIAVGKQLAKEIRNNVKRLGYENIFYF